MEAHAICPPEAGAFTIYVSPAGSDSNSGLTSLDPLHSLAAANALLDTSDPPQAVHVRIDPNNGPFMQTDAVLWTYFNSSHDTVLLPYDTTICSLTSARWSGSRPVFTYSGNASKNWFNFKPTENVPSGSVPTNLYLLGLEVRGFRQNGIAFNPPAGRTFTNNVFANLSFFDIGNAGHPNLPWGYGAIQLDRSSNNVIKYSRFQRIENDEGIGLDGKSHLHSIHAIYLHIGSDNNLIFENKMIRVSGDPIKARDGSDYNNTHHNTFDRTGHLGFFQDYFAAGECAGFRNRLEFNDTDGDNDGLVREGWTESGNGPQISYTNPKSPLPTGCPTDPPRFIVANNDVVGAGSSW